MPKLVLEISDDVTDALRLPPGEQNCEVRKEFALALYRRGALSLGKARRLADMSLCDFERLLGERQIPRHYTAEDLEDDVRYAEGR